MCTECNYVTQRTSESIQAKIQSEIFLPSNPALTPQRLCQRFRRMSIKQTVQTEEDKINNKYGWYLLQHRWIKISILLQSLLQHL